MSAKPGNGFTFNEQELTGDEPETDAIIELKSLLMQIGQIQGAAIARRDLNTLRFLCSQLLVLLGMAGELLEESGDALS